MSQPQIKSRRQHLRLWFEFYKLALADPQLQSNLAKVRNFYEPWGDPRGIDFREWWKDHSYLFGETQVEEITKVSKAPNVLSVSIPLNMPAVDQETGQPTIVNNVTKVKAKIVLDDVPSTPTYRMQQLQMMTEITKSLPPQLQAQVVDFVIEATDMPKRHMLADRIRAAVGIQNPEQQQAAMEAQQQAAAMQQDMAQKTFVLDSAERAAKIRKLNAEAEKIQTESIRAKYQPMIRTPKVDVQAPEIN
jgi:hypothetical protein